MTEREREGGRPARREEIVLVGMREHRYVRGPMEMKYLIFGLLILLESTVGTVRPLYRTGVSLLSRERFLYI